MLLRKLLLFLLLPCAALAQTAVIPANSMTFTGVVNGTPVSLTGPTQAVTINVSGLSSGLPTGMTYSSTAGLSVIGPITSSGMVTATEVSLTGGAVLPSCTSGLYLYQYTASTNALTPVCLSPVTVTQATVGGPITITP
jgi:hypothetical protein